MSGEYEESEPKPKKQCFICYGSSDTINNPLLDGLCTCKNGLEVAHGRCMAKWLLRYKHKSCEMCHSSYYQKEYFNIDQSDTTSRKGQLRVITNYFLIPVSYHLLIGIIFILFRLIVMPILLAYGWHHLQIHYGFTKVSHESTPTLRNIIMTGVEDAATTPSVWSIQESQNINRTNLLYNELSSVVNKHKTNINLSNHINSSTIATDITRMLADRNTNSTVVASFIASLYQMNYVLAIAVTILAEATFVWWFKFKLAVNKVISKHPAHRRKAKKQTRSNNGVTTTNTTTSIITATTSAAANTESSYTLGNKVERENADNNDLFSLFNRRTEDHDNVCNVNEEVNGTVGKNDSSNNTNKNNGEEEKDSEWEDVSGENEERGEGEELLYDNDDDNDNDNEDNDEEGDDNNEEGGDFAMMIHMFSVSNLYKFSEWAYNEWTLVERHAIFTFLSVYVAWVTWLMILPLAIAHCSVYVSSSCAIVVLTLVHLSTKRIRARQVKERLTQSEEMLVQSTFCDQLLWFATVVQSILMSSFVMPFIQGIIVYMLLHPYFASSVKTHSYDYNNYNDNITMGVATSDTYTNVTSPNVEYLHNHANGETLYMMLLEKVVHYIIYTFQTLRSEWSLRLILAIFFAGRSVNSINSALFTNVLRFALAPGIELWPFKMHLPVSDDDWPVIISASMCSTPLSLLVDMILIMVRDCVLEFGILYCVLHSTFAIHHVLCELLTNGLYLPIKETTHFQPSLLLSLAMHWPIFSSLTGSAGLHEWFELQHLELWNTTLSSLMSDKAMLNLTENYNTPSMIYTMWDESEFFTQNTSTSISSSEATFITNSITAATINKPNTNNTVHNNIDVEYEYNDSAAFTGNSTSAASNDDASNLHSRSEHSYFRLVTWWSAYERTHPEHTNLMPYREQFAVGHFVDLANESIGAVRLSASEINNNTVNHSSSSSSVTATTTTVSSSETTQHVDNNEHEEQNYDNVSKLGSMAPTDNYPVSISSNQDRHADDKNNSNNNNNINFKPYQQLKMALIWRPSLPLTKEYSLTPEQAEEVLDNAIAEIKQVIGSAPETYAAGISAAADLAVENNVLATLLGIIKIRPINLQSPLIVMLNLLSLRMSLYDKEVAYDVIRLMETKKWLEWSLPMEHDMTVYYMTQITARQKNVNHDSATNETERDVTNTHIRKRTHTNEHKTINEEKEHQQQQQKERQKEIVLKIDLDELQRVICKAHHTLSKRFAQQTIPSGLIRYDDNVGQLFLLTLKFTHHFFMIYKLFMMVSSFFFRHAYLLQLCALFAEIVKFLTLSASISMFAQIPLMHVLLPWTRYLAVKIVGIQEVVLDETSYNYVNEQIQLGWALFTSFMSEHHIEFPTGPNLTEQQRENLLLWPTMEDWKKSLESKHIILPSFLQLRFHVLGSVVYLISLCLIWFLPILAGSVALLLVSSADEYIYWTLILSFAVVTQGKVFAILQFAAFTALSILMLPIFILFPVVKAAFNHPIEKLTESIIDYVCERTYLIAACYGSGRVYEMTIKHH